MSPDTDNADTGTIMFFRLAADSRKLRDEERVRRFLYEAIRAIGCRGLGDLIVHVPEAIRKTGEEPYADEGGVSGVAVLSTSKVDIHTWPALTASGHIAPWNGAARGTVDSCRPFRFELVIDVIKTVFEPDYLRVVDWTAALRSYSGIVIPCTEAQRRWK